MSDLDLPIALRRKRRSCCVVVGNSTPASSSSSSSSAPVPKTPKKRVRFSDPGPESEPDGHGLVDELSLSSSTGLTPMIKRSSLGSSEREPKRRRRSASSSSTTTTTTTLKSIGGEEQQERKKTRTRTRTITSSTKKKEKEKERDLEAELRRLRDELDNRDKEIERLLQHNEETVQREQDTERIVELEGELEILRSRNQFSPPANNDDTVMEEDEEEELELPAQQKSFYDWTLAARDPDYYDYDMEEEEEDDDDIAQSTPCKKRIGGGGMMLFTPPPPQKTKTKSVSASFPTPPNTSPAPAPVPAPMNVDMGVDMGVQVSFPDPEKEKLKHVKEGLTVQNGELARHLGILRAEVTRHEEVWGRMVGKLKLPLPNPAASNNNNNNSAEAIIIIEGKIHEILTGLDDLGFPDIQSLANYVRQARLELERMAPGEITYGLYESPHGKEILDMVLERLRKAREDAETIDMYHAQEFSLRQQLGDRIAVCQLRDKEIAELKVGVERHVIAAGSYQRDIAELEELVRRLEEEGQGRDEEVVRARVKIDELQDEIVKLRDEIAKLQLTRKAETKVRNESQRSLITVWEKRVGELRRRIYGLEEELKGAGETVLKLRLENAELVEEKMKMKKTGGMRTRSMSVSADGSSSSSYLSGDLARRKRRRPDSGLGLMDGDEDDVEFVS